MATESSVIVKGFVNLHLPFHFSNVNNCSFKSWPVLSRLPLFLEFPVEPLHVSLTHKEAKESILSPSSCHLIMFLIPFKDLDLAFYLPSDKAYVILTR